MNKNLKTKTKTTPVPVVENIVGCFSYDYGVVCGRSINLQTTTVMNNMKTIG